MLCFVVAVSDGDTLTARCDASGASAPIKVRIAAIDAPERKQAYGPQARANLVHLCARQQATIEPLDTDAYGRTVANVRCGSTDVATAQVSAGLAWVYTQYAKNHPHLPALQRQARESGTGLWSQPRPLAPWDYRRRYQQRR